MPIKPGTYEQRTGQTDKDEIICNPNVGTNYKKNLPKPKNSPKDDIPENEKEDSKKMIPTDRLVVDQEKGIYYPKSNNPETKD